MSHPDLDDLARRPARYWLVDGLPELMLGLLWMLWGAAWLVGQALPRGAPWNLYWLVVPPVLAAAGLAITRMTRRLKQHVTFPRTGYVAWKEPDRPWVFGAAIVAAATTLALVVLIARTQSIEASMPAVISVILSLSFLALGVRHRAPHFLALAAVTVALALAIASVTTGWTATNWLFVTLGGACAAVGAVRLTRFVRAHPRAATEGV